MPVDSHSVVGLCCVHTEFDTAGNGEVVSNGATQGGYLCTGVYFVSYELEEKLMKSWHK